MHRFHPSQFLPTLLAALAAAWLLLAWSPAEAFDSDARRAEGPYFEVRSGDPGTDRFPLKSTAVDVRITGPIAEVTVVQRYRNDGQRPIEARYVFPGSTTSAVHAMTVRLGERVLVAQIREKQQARIEYDAAKREGRTSALLEQHRPNVFGMNVANILPGDDVAVELRYTELLAPVDGRYAFVYPTVVGPRYHAPAGGGGAASFPATPILRPGDALPAPAFELAVALDMPLAVQELASTTHAMRIEGVGTAHATARLVADGKPAADRDVVLGYRLAGDATAAGLVLFRGETENFFLGLVEPPRAVPVQQIVPREYVFVVDVSGSMHGHPLETAKVLLENLIGSLRPSDTFNVLLFSGSSRMLAEKPVPATKANVERALATLRAAQGGGSTEIVPALKRIAALPKAVDASRTVVVVTDGYVTVENDVFRLIRKNLGETNVFAFGIGSSVNRHLIEGIARAGMGEAFVVTKSEDAAAQAERLRRTIDAPVLVQVKARLEGVEAYDVEPEALPDVLGGRPVVVFGKWRGDAAAAASARLVVEGRAADGAWRTEVAPSGGGADAAAGSLRHLWARHRIAALADQEALEGGGAQKDRIVALGLTYGLLTNHTSFVAVDRIVRNPNPALAPSVDQPLPLPAGVGERAVGGDPAAALGAEVPGTPEPAFWVALLVTLAVVGCGVARIGRRP
jgi:Ca-activated chloride channel family protein